jgi:hypothetical protein
MIRQIMWRRAWLAALTCSVLIVSGSGCAGESASRTYSADEVLQAFEAADYPLVEQPPPAGTPAAAEGTILLPKGGSGSAVAVFVGTDEEADDAWADYVRLGGDEDSLTVRRANVVAISDGGLSSPREEARTRSDERPPGSALCRRRAGRRMIALPGRADIECDQSQIGREVA